MSMTISQLKQELINHGVTLPESNARKDAYEKLYHEHVVKVKSAKAQTKIDKTTTREEGFSSDEDIISGNGDDDMNATNVVKSYLDPLIQKEVDSLTDEEIYLALINLGQIIGPVVSTTREMYKRRLTKLRSCLNAHTDEGPLQESAVDPGYEDEIHINGHRDDAFENAQQFSSDDDTSEPVETVKVCNEKIKGLSDKEKELLEILMTSRRKQTSTLSSSASEGSLKMKSHKVNTGDIFKANAKETGYGIKTWFIGLLLLLLSVYIAYEYFEVTNEFEIDVIGYGRNRVSGFTNNRSGFKESIFKDRRQEKK